MTHLKSQFLIWDLWYFSYITCFKCKIYSLLAIQRHCMISKDSTNVVKTTFLEHSHPFWSLTDVVIMNIAVWKITKWWQFSTALTQDKTLSKPESYRVERCGTPPRSWAWGCGTLWSACWPWSGGWGWKRSAGSGANPPGRPLVRVHQREEAELISQTWAENTQTDKSELKIIDRRPEQSSRDQASQRRPSQGGIRRIKKERNKYCVSKMKISKHKHKPHTFSKTCIKKKPNSRYLLLLS